MFFICYSMNNTYSLQQVNIFKKSCVSTLLSKNLLKNYTRLYSCYVKGVSSYFDKMLIKNDFLKFINLYKIKTLVTIKLVFNNFDINTFIW